MVQMQYKPAIAILSIIMCSLIIALVVVLKLIPVTEVFVAIVAGLVTIAIYSGWWGFKNMIEDKKENREFYAPIHAMIKKANNKFSQEDALEGTVGAWVSVKQLGIDYRKISETFDQNSTKFKDDDLKKWVKLKEEITKPIKGGGFFLGKDAQEWFDDLERRFND